MTAKKRLFALQKVKWPELEKPLSQMNFATKCGSKLGDCDYNYIAEIKFWTFYTGTILGANIFFLTPNANLFIYFFFFFENLHWDDSRSNLMFSSPQMLFFFYERSAMTI